MGMGIAERRMRTRFSPRAINHRIFVIAGDGDFRRALPRAASLAGTLTLAG